ncbi:unnamed protein product [Sphagnum jensenii]|uniref:Uncharacterized protein n=1 Tax=Sphagnum jensenii TaxID=128206 RepID=A0ABP0W3F2_9BRYO
MVTRILPLADLDSLPPEKQALLLNCCKLVLLEFYRLVKNAEEIIQGCCSQDWLKAAIKLANNTEAFVEAAGNSSCGHERAKDTEDRLATCYRTRKVGTHQSNWQRGLWVGVKVSIWGITLQVPVALHIMLQIAETMQYLH